MTDAIKCVRYILNRCFEAESDVEMVSFGEIFRSTGVNLSLTPETADEVFEKLSAHPEFQCIEKTRSYFQCKLSLEYQPPVICLREQTKPEIELT